jgi:hypothetical protein
LRRPRATAQVQDFHPFPSAPRRKLDPRLKHVFTVTHSLKEGTEKTGERRPFAVDRENQIGGFWPRKAHGILNCASRYWRGHDENA